MEKAVRDMKKYYDKCRQDALEYEIRDQVYLKGSHILLRGDYQRLMMELLSLIAVMLEGLGFNLCVVPFLNICVLNLIYFRGSEMECVGGGRSLVRGVILELGGGRLSQIVVRMKAKED